MLERLVLGLEWVAAALLGVLAILSVGSFATTLLAARSAGLFERPAIFDLLDELFVIFIVIELFRMTFAYMRGTRVLPVAFEAVMIAVARKMVALDYSADHILTKTISLGIVTLTIAIAAAVTGRWSLFERP